MVVPFETGKRREHTDSMPVIKVAPARGAEPAHASRADEEDDVGGPRADDEDEDFEEPGPATIGSSLDDVSFCEHSLLVGVSSRFQADPRSRRLSPACAITGRPRQTSGAREPC